MYMFVCIYAHIYVYPAFFLVSVKMMILEPSLSTIFSMMRCSLRGLS